MANCRIYFSWDPWIESQFKRINPVTACVLGSCTKIIQNIWRTKSFTRCLHRIILFLGKMCCTSTRLTCSMDWFKETTGPPRFHGKNHGFRFRLFLKYPLNSAPKLGNSSATFLRRNSSNRSQPAALHLPEMAMKQGGEEFCEIKGMPSEGYYLIMLIRDR